ncbi:hypothetical protein BCEP27_10462 [Burkholderia cepacia]
MPRGACSTQAKWDKEKGSGQRKGDEGKGPTRKGKRLSNHTAHPGWNGLHHAQNTNDVHTGLPVVAWHMPICICCFEKGKGRP